MLSDEEVTQIAYRTLLTGAESYAEDWIDEEGEYSEEDGDRIFNKLFQLLGELKAIYLHAN